MSKTPATTFVVDPYKDDPRWINAKARWEAGRALLEATGGRFGMGQIVSASMDQREVERIYLNNLQEALDYFVAAANWAIGEGFGPSNEEAMAELRPHLRNLELALGVTTTKDVS